MLLTTMGHCSCSVFTKFARVEVVEVENTPKLQPTRTIWKPQGERKIGGSVIWGPTITKRRKSGHKQTHLRLAKSLAARAPFSLKLPTSFSWLSPFRPSVGSEVNSLKLTSLKYERYFTLTLQCTSHMQTSLSGCQDSSADRGAVKPDHLSPISQIHSRRKPTPKVTFYPPHAHCAHTRMHRTHVKIMKENLCIDVNIVNIYLWYIT